MHKSDRFALIALILAAIAGVAGAIGIGLAHGWIAGVICGFIPLLVTAEFLGKKRNGV